MQTIQPPPHANLEVLTKSPEKPGDWDLKPGDFQNMRQIKKTQIICLSVFFTFLEPLLYSFAAFFALEFWTTSSHFEICACSKAKLSQRP